MIILAADTETTGFASDAPLDDPKQPHIVQLGALLKEDDVVRAEINLIIKPDGWVVPAQVAEIHGISTEIAEKYGVPLRLAMEAFEHLVRQADLLVFHNFAYDNKLIQIAHARLKMKSAFTSKKWFCTMQATTPILKLPKARGGGYKWPKLQEAYAHFFGEEFDGAHDASADVRATERVFSHLRKEELISL